MELLLALPVGHTAPPTHYGLLTAHMAYRIGNGPVLLGIRLPDDLQGGFMLLDCEGFDGMGDPLPCCSQILGECRRRNYRGIICDFEGPATDCLEKLLTVLDQYCAREGWALHVPEHLAAHAPGARVLIPSGVTAGTLERRLRSAKERYGQSRPVLAVEWLRQDLPLPTEGKGESLTQLALENQMRRLEPAVFFDRGLCAHYYTYMTGSQAHFVVFDTPRSIRAKIALAEQLELPAVLMAAPEADGRWKEIFG
jgi:hypothetical protein